MQDGLRVRVSVRELERRYNEGDKQPLEDLLRAWKGIKELPPEDPNSFYVLGGFHGAPFAYRDSDRLYWGGYCNHGNVLFPTWHRVYVYKLENALRTIVPSVTMPFWDETSEESLTHGIPEILTAETVELDGEVISNPLRSFVLPAAISDEANAAQAPTGNVENLYAKPKGYETERYPRSGLVGTPAASAATEAHNVHYSDPAENARLLNENVMAWLAGNNPTPSDPHPAGNKGIYWMFEDCLRASNYTIFSNSTSAHGPNGEGHKALEDPHNDIHVSVGGIDTLGIAALEKAKAAMESGQIAGSNGDMGENNTAALDPIFFFHHCNVDRMFWLWQTQTGHVDSIEIIEGDPGANSNASQGPTVGYDWDTELTVESPLYPFVTDDGDPYISLDCLNIVEQMGYVYGPGSFDDGPAAQRAVSGRSTKTLTVSAVDRSLFEGSFVLSAHATVADPQGDTIDYYLGHHTVLSRGNVINCANCLAHLEVVAHFSLDALPAEQVDHATFSVQVRHRGDTLPDGLSFQLEVRS